jgi:hypothetical protein
MISPTRYPVPSGAQPPYCDALHIARLERRLIEQFDSPLRADLSHLLTESLPSGETGEHLVAPDQAAAQVLPTPLVGKATSPPLLGSRAARFGALFWGVTRHAGSHPKNVHVGGTSELGGPRRAVQRIAPSASRMLRAAAQCDGRAGGASSPSRGTKTRSPRRSCGLLVFFLLDADSYRGDTSSCRRGAPRCRWLPQGGRPFGE